MKNISEARKDGRLSFSAYRWEGAGAYPTNPHPIGSPEYVEWNHGVTDAQYELTERIGNE